MPSLAACAAGGLVGARFHKSFALMLLNVLIQHRGRVSGVKGSTGGGGGGGLRCFQEMKRVVEGGGLHRPPRQVDHPN